MKIIFDNETMKNDCLNDKYSKYAAKENLIEGMPYVNFPFEVIDLPIETKYISWIFVDHDSNPVVSFSWIHWLIANYRVQGNKAIVVEGLVDSDEIYEGGQNSYASPLANVKDERIILNYGGPRPPDKPHNYTLEVFAHKEKLDLKNGFFYNEFLDELEKKQIEKVKIKVLAKA